MGSCFLHWIRARNNVVPLFGICSCDFCTLLNSSMKSYLLITFILILVYKFEAANVPVDADDVEKAKKRTKNKKGTKNNKFKGVEGQGDRKSPKAKQKRIRKNNQSNKKGTPKNRKGRKRGSGSIKNNKQSKNLKVSKINKANKNKKEPKRKAENGSTSKQTKQGKKNPMKRKKKKTFKGKHNSVSKTKRQKKKKSKVKPKSDGKMRRPKQKSGKNHTTTGKKGLNLLRQNTSSSCLNVSCLNDILQVLKVEKDTAKNFIKQQMQITRHEGTISGKSGKKGNFDSDAKLLVSSCKEANITGKTSNSSIKQAATSVITALLKCNTTIKTACVQPSGAVDKDKMKACNTSVVKYMADSTKCQAKSGSERCSCFGAMVKDQVPAVKKCSFKTESGAMKTGRKTCLKAFSACKSAQDNATFIMTKCRDPLPMLRKKLTALKKALDGTIKANTALKLLDASPTTSTPSAGRRHKREVIVTSVTIITTVTTFSSTLITNVLDTTIQTMALNLLFWAKNSLTLSFTVEQK